MNNNYPSKDVRRLLGWTEQQYCDFQYESGLEYLQAYIPDDQHGIDMLSRSRIFWNWWKNHWAMRDEQFISVAEEYTKGNEKLYRTMNSSKALTSKIYPNAAVLEESYAVMIDNIINAY